MHLTLHLMLHSRVHLPVQSRMPLRVHLKICLMVYFEIYIKMHKKRILGWIQGCTLGNYWVTLVDVHGGALVSAQECKKRFSKKLNLRENSMLHLNARLIFHFTEHLKMYKNVKEEIYFMLQVIIHLTMHSRSAPEGTIEGAPNDALINLHKDAKEGAFEVALGLHQWLHLLKQSLIYKFVKKWFI